MTTGHRARGNVKVEIRVIIGGSDARLDSLGPVVATVEDAEEFLRTGAAHDHDYGVAVVDHETGLIDWGGEYTNFEGEDVSLLEVFSRNHDGETIDVVVGMTKEDIPEEIMKKVLDDHNKHRFAGCMIYGYIQNTDGFWEQEIEKLIDPDTMALIEAIEATEKLR